METLSGCPSEVLQIQLHTTSIVARYYGPGVILTIKRYTASRETGDSWLVEVRRYNGPIMRSTCNSLILTDDRRRAAAWRKAIQGRATPDAAGAVAVFEPADAMETPPAVILTDGPDPAQTLPEEFRPLLAGGRIGVVGVGRAVVGDVTLPTDATPRELTLACRLLSQIVQLRRQCRAESQENRALRRLATSDPLTGLPNRRAWDEQLGRAADGDFDAPGAACLALLDLDHFKRINDQFGHATGDRVLTVFAQAIASNIRENDFAARLGGDEFGLLLAGVEPAAAEQVVEHIRVESGQAVAESDLPPITASAGFLSIDASAGHDPEQLYTIASDALREAKNTGRDRTVAAP